MKTIKANPILPIEDTGISEPKRSVQKSYDDLYKDQMTPGPYRSNPTEEDSRENTSRMTALRLLADLDKEMNGMAIILDIADHGDGPIGMPDKQSDPDAYVEYLEYLNEELTKKVRKAVALINATKEVIKEKDPNRMMLPFNIEHRQKLRE